MADELQTPPQGDPAPSTPPATPTPQTDPAPHDPPPAGDPQDVEGYRRALEAARAEAKEAKREASSLKRAHDDMAAKVKAEEDAKKSAEERALARAEAAEQALRDAETRIRTQNLRHAVTDAARSQSFHNPADAYRFLDLDTVEFDDDGNPKGIDDLVKALAREREYLVKSGDPPRGPQPTPRSSGNGALSAEDRAKLDRDFALHTRSRF